MVSFPDIDNCFTDADTLTGAVEYAQDVLGLMLSEMEKDGEVIPVPSKSDTIKVPEGASLVMIQIDTDNFREGAK
ncbi:type II toxin-antitoxin system HicB family antitoxin [Fictibacillus norfolkensis]|uniref:type II toxin-antitoxin system HicB family antitoxin n=1 Tax=Fictibacillus norfolkensis TaxID=2762233 RepID=UPI00296A9A5A|nr:type II toxin-antitoxin system HicB family antitoxin [Fictibacillus norfolkensis]